MNLKKKFVLSATLLFLIISSIACNIGLGPEVDMDAPEITITSPLPLSNVHLEFVLEGTCKDNKSVTSVTVVNAETGKVFEPVVINGEKWSCAIKLNKEDEGDISFTCTANDEMGNKSISSTKNITLHVDDTAPEGLSWYLARGNGIQIDLKEKEDLIAVDTNLSVNKDIPQNEIIEIHGRIFDAISIKEVTLNLFDENENKIISKTVEGSFTPIFTFTHEELVASNSKLATGKHYLRASYECKDDHNNAGEKELNWLLWYPESDNPGIYQKQTKDNQLNVNVDATIPFDFFDDDGLTEIKCAIRNPSSISGITVKQLIENEAERTKAFSNAANDETIILKSYTELLRDDPITISAPTVGGKRTLIACAKDIHGKWNAVIIDTMVLDGATPLLYIESPAENTIPAIKTGTNSTFEIKGYGLDTRGCSTIKIMYVPDNIGNSEQKESYAKTNLEEDKTKEGKSTDVATGGKIWCGTLNKAEDESGWKKQSFTFAFDILQDFGNEAASNKFLELMIVDTDNNKVFQQLKLNGDTVSPVVNVYHPNIDLTPIDYKNDEFIIKFKGEKESGLGMNDEKYKIVFNGEDYTIANGKLTKDSDGWIKTDNLQPKLEGIYNINSQPKIDFYVEDVLGNMGIGQRTIILTALPKLEEISSSKATYKAGDEISIDVKFSAAVDVTGSPKLKIKYSEDDNEPEEAIFSSGSGSDNLVFKFTVPKGASSEGISCPYENTIILDGGTIKEAGGTGDAYITIVPNGKNLQREVIEIDGIAPKVTDISISTTVSKNSDNKYYVKAGEKITATVEVDSKVTATSPLLELYTDQGVIQFIFETINTDGNILTFSHTVTESSAQGIIYSDASKYFTDCSKIKDEVGNPIENNEQSNKLESSIVVDSIAPASAPALSIESGTYNSVQKFTLTVDSDCTAKYSTDGGANWKDYQNKEIELQSGSYQIKSQQTDKAGNTTISSSSVDVIINATFPSVTGLSVAKADGDYKAGEKIDFKLSFNDKVKPTKDSAAKLKFKKINGTTTAQKEVPVTVNDTLSSTITFTYTVAENDDLQGIEITAVELTGDLLDQYGNKPASTNTPFTYIPVDSEKQRTGINLDGIAPKIDDDGYLPVKDAKVTDGNKVTLTFSEDIFKESGNITLKRKGNWALPPVLTETEFYKVYNELSSTEQENLMFTDNGSPRVHSMTGQPIGPYKRITWGLKEDGNGDPTAVPDTATKFVLDFGIDIYDTTKEVTLDTGYTITGSAIRSAFEAAGYDRQILDVTSSSVQVSGKKVTIEFPDTLVDGREWELYIDAGCFRDKSGNTFAGLGDLTNRTTTYSYWSDKVAKPVIRVDRYSHGWGALEPNSAGARPTSTPFTAYASTSWDTNDAASKTAPANKALVRVDCETPGVSVKYGTTGIVTKTQNTSDTQTSKGNYSVTDKTTDEIKGITASTDLPESKMFLVGDGELNTARRDYVKAVATKTGFTPSDAGYEGVFKTVVIHNETGGKPVVKIQGGTAAGGMPIYSGFPLRDATFDERYSKNAYTSDGKLYYWTSYEIVSSFQEMGMHDSNYTKSYYDCNYGLVTYIYNVEWY